jgi:nucleotide-binding universal stress UspA family protein
MRQPTQNPQGPQAPQEREAGRSFHDPSRALGEEILQRSAHTTAPTKENFRARARQAADQAAVDRHGVAERAKVIGVLRKAEEFMSTSNPAPDTDADVRRALDLSCGRLGLTFQEYRALADSDPELVEFERHVIAEARRRWGAAPTTPAAAASQPEPERPAEAAAKMLDRVFVAVDYTMDSHRAVGVALELRRTHGSTVCLFHAAESTGSDDWLAGIGSPAVAGDWVVETEERLRRFLRNVAPDADADIEVRARVGLPVSSLCVEAHRWGATLVIATARLHTRIVRSPAEQIVRQVGLPILIIPAE